ncbi:hypothetical protein [Proteus phage vB_PmiP_RS51pmB]|nr:hypothetical protein [Proteus phage vB_PmiP_RS51pmB]
MKIKCISNIDLNGRVSDYLTVGKLYDMTPCDEENDAGEIIDDASDVIFEYLPVPVHGKWEVVK